MSVFETQHILRKLLPTGCYTIQLSRCSEGKNMSLLLSSTSHWFEMKSNKNIRYTLGIVFVELNDLALPVSMTGVQVLGEKSDFSLKIGSDNLSPSQGFSIGHTKNNTDFCWSFDITPRYLYDFLKSMSFLRSFLTNIEKDLPKWISFSKEGTELFGLHDLKMEFMHGSDISSDNLCKGAPVFEERLYSVFKFGGNFSMTIYGDEITLPTPLMGQKYCFIIDLCQDSGGSVFLMIPEDSRSVLENFQVFKSLSEKYNLHIRPKGLGFSLQKHVNVHTHSTELQLWNGDEIFAYK